MKTHKENMLAIEQKKKIIHIKYVNIYKFITVINHMISDSNI